VLHCIRDNRKAQRGAEFVFRGRGGYGRMCRKTWMESLTKVTMVVARTELDAVATQDNYPQLGNKDARYEPPSNRFRYAIATNNKRSHLRANHVRILGASQSCPRPIGVCKKSLGKAAVFWNPPLNFCQTFSVPGMAAEAMPSCHYLTLTVANSRRAPERRRGP
jgi:hypothetical protein